MRHRIFLSCAIVLFSAKLALCDESYETDRGYREPAVVGQAIPEEEAQSIVESINNGNGDGFDSGNVPAAVTDTPLPVTDEVSFASEFSGTSGASGTSGSSGASGTSEGSPELPSVDTAYR